MRVLKDTPKYDGPVSRLQALFPEKTQILRNPGLENARLSNPSLRDIFMALKRQEWDQGAACDGTKMNFFKYVNNEPSEKRTDTEEKRNPLQYTAKLAQRLDAGQ